MHLILLCSIIHSVDLSQTHASSCIVIIVLTNPHLWHRRKSCILMHLILLCSLIHILDLTESNASSCIVIIVLTHPLPYVCMMIKHANNCFYYKHMAVKSDHCHLSLIDYFLTRYTLTKSACTYLASIVRLSTNYNNILHTFCHIMQSLINLKPTEVTTLKWTDYHFLLKRNYSLLWNRRQPSYFVVNIEIITCSHISLFLYHTNACNLWSINTSLINVIVEKDSSPIWPLTSARDSTADNTSAWQNWNYKWSG